MYTKKSFHLLLLDCDRVGRKMNVLGEVIQCGAFSINAQRSILIAKVLFQESFGRAQQPKRQLFLHKSDKLKSLNV